MTQDLQTEISTLHQTLDALQKERESLSVTLPLPPEDAPPEAIVEAYRDRARASAEQAAELKGLDDAIAALESQLRQKKALVGHYREHRRDPLKAEIERAKLDAEAHADRINELTLELAEEVRALKSIADDLSPLYWQYEGKPFITGFKRVTVPYVQSDGAVWRVINKVI